MGLFSKIFGTYSEKQIKKLMPIVEQIEDLGPKFKEMSDAEMRSMTDTFKERLANGETLDDILPEAYALVREAADRVLGKRPFRVQLMCAILLHQGRVAEMKTGEGKTLVAVLPAYLNALTGKGVHIVTVNDYLADLGRDEMGRIHEFLGLTTGLVVHGQTREEKQKAYNCDITYGTNNEFGFDYLRDNMVIYKKDKCQREHNFAIVDEVDSILIDEARTPLIISGEGKKSTELYDKVDAFVKGLRKHVVKELDMKVLNDLVYVLDTEFYDVAENGSSNELKSEREIYTSFESLTSRIDALKDAYLNEKMPVKTETELNDKYLIDKAFLFEAGAKNGNKTDYLRIKVEARDYIVDEKARTATLTKHGVEKAERYFELDVNSADATNEDFEDDFNENLLTSPKNSELNHHIQVAIRAHGIMQRDTDYVIRDNQVIIVDSFTGRLMPGRRYNDGLHQAIEAKEHVKVQKENRTVATITFQNYFRMYKKLSGMTGTALSEEMEFREIYDLDVVEVPTNKPMIRKDYNDAVYRTKAGKDRAIIRQIKECRAKGQPVLVGTVSVEKSEMLSQKLKNEGIPHNVLNAKHHEKEAEIVAQAGKLGAVTISTNMAGRGTDIMLGGNAEYLAKKELKKQGYEDETIALATGSSQTVSEDVLEARRLFVEYYDRFKEEIAPEAEKVREAGGLFIIGTERHESRRIDNQLRGRSGRQGDPGESRFYLSFEDDLMRLFGSDRIVGLVTRMGLDEDTPIDAKLLSGTIENSQKRIESSNFQRRKYVLAYDDVMNQQRNTIYAQRSEALESDNLKEKIERMIVSTIKNAVHEHTAGAREEWDLVELKSKYMGLICFPGDFTNDDITREEITDLLTDRALKLWKEKENLLGEEGARENERVILLRNVDEKWMNHLETMEDLRDSISLQSYAQRNPINEYKLAGADLFDEMVMSIRDDTVREILSTQQMKKRVQVIRAVGEGFANGSNGQKKTTQAQKPVRVEKIGRNDPCPCGSGKKYKKCCGANQGGE